MSKKDKSSNFYKCNSFYETFKKLMEDVENRNMLLPAIVVNGCFCIEVSIKSLLQSLNIKYKKSHHLFYLFELIPFDLKEKILSSVCDSNIASVEKFYEELLVTSDSFEKWRYQENSVIANVGFIEKLLFTIWDIVFPVKFRFVMCDSFDENSDEFKKLDNKFSETYINQMRKNYEKLNKTRKVTKE